MAQRRIKIDLRLTEEEAAALNRDVEKSGLSRESYLRKLIKGHPIRERPCPDLVELLKLMQNSCNNLNQIALVANSRQFIDTKAYWDNVQWQQEHISKLLEVMY